MYKILGQSMPVASTVTKIYEVPATKQAVVSTVTICNISPSSGTFRLHVLDSADTPEDYNAIIWDAPIGLNESLFLTIGITLQEGEGIYFVSTTAEATVTIFGDEK